jgi:hypothetical protein
LTKLRFGVAPLVDVSPDGGVIAVAHVGSEEGVPSFSVTLISADGDTIYHHEHQYTPAAIQESVRRTEEARIAKRKSQVPGFPDVTVPRFYPPLRSLIAGRDSCVWIELDGASGQRSWLVVDDTGSIADTVHVPDSMRLLAVRRRHFWAALRDPADVESIVKYLLAGTVH